MREPITGTFDSEAGMLQAIGAGATDRFSGQAPEGYVSIVFNNADAHQIILDVKHQTGASVYTLNRTVSRVVLPWTARGLWFRLPVRGRLEPGRYALHLTIDGLAAGVYPFTVD